LRKSLFALALLLLLFSANSHAVSLKLPSTIVVQQSQKDVLIELTNDGLEEQAYSLSFSVPNASIAQSHGMIGAGETISAILSVKPGEKFEGSTYEGSLEASVGDERAFKKVSVIFKEKEGIIEDINGMANIGFFSLAGAAEFAVSLFTLENALNLGLALLAAILLIAFIARFVKRLVVIK